MGWRNTKIRHKIKDIDNKINELHIELMEVHVYGVAETMWMLEKAYYYLSEKGLIADNVLSLQTLVTMQYWSFYSPLQTIS